MPPGSGTGMDSQTESVSLLTEMPRLAADVAASLAPVAWLAMARLPAPVRRPERHPPMCCTGVQAHALTETTGSGMAARSGLRVCKSPMPPPESPRSLFFAADGAWAQVVDFQPLWTWLNHERVSERACCARATVCGWVRGRYFGAHRLLLSHAPPSARIFTMSFLDCITAASVPWCCCSW